MPAVNGQMEHVEPHSEWPPIYGGMLLGPTEGEDKLLLCLDAPTSELALSALSYHVMTPRLIIRQGYGTLFIPRDPSDVNEDDISVIDFSTVKLQNIRLVYKALKDVREGKNPIDVALESRVEPVLRRLGGVAVELVDAEPKLATLTHDDQRPIYDPVQPETLWMSERVSAYLSLNPIFEPFDPPKL